MTTATTATTAAPVETLADRAERAAAATTADAHATYRQLIHRNAEPREGDDVLLLLTMRTLGKSADDLRADLALIDQRRKLAARLDQLTDAGDADALTAKAAKLAAELRTIEADLRALQDREQATRNGAMSAAQHATLIRNHMADIARFEAAHADLFGVASP